MEPPKSIERKRPITSFNEKPARNHAPEVAMAIAKKNPKTVAFEGMRQVSSHALDLLLRTIWFKGIGDESTFGAAA
jgi:hypothetical protein